LRETDEERKRRHSNYLQSGEISTKSVFPTPPCVALFTNPLPSPLPDWASWQSEPSVAMVVAPSHPSKLTNDQERDQQPPANAMLGIGAEPAKPHPQVLAKWKGSERYYPAVIDHYDARNDVFQVKYVPSAYSPLDT
jgi:hypothetical protein